MRWRYLLRVYALCLVVLAALGGAIEAWRVLTALRPFGAEHHAAGLLAVSMIHRCPPVAALAACVALVLHLHRSPPGDSPDTRGAWTVMVTLPAAALGAALVAICLGVLLVRSAVPFTESWAAIRERVSYWDFLSALGRSSAASMVLGVLAAALLPRLAKRPRWHVVAKVALAWLVSTIATGVVDASWSYAFGELEHFDPKSE